MTNAPEDETDEDMTPADLSEAPDIVTYSQSDTGDTTTTRRCYTKQCRTVSGKVYPCWYRKSDGSWKCSYCCVA